MIDMIDIAILRLVKNGLSMHKIAKSLQISSYTVQKRIHKMYLQKLIDNPSSAQRVLTPVGEMMSKDLGMKSPQGEVFDRRY